MLLSSDFPILHFRLLYMTGNLLEALSGDRSRSPQTVAGLLVELGVSGAVDLLSHRQG